MWGYWQILYSCEVQSAKLCLASNKKSCFEKEITFIKQFAIPYCKCWLNSSVLNSLVCTYLTFVFECRENSFKYMKEFSFAFVLLMHAFPWSNYSHLPQREIDSHDKPKWDFHLNLAQGTREMFFKNKNLSEGLLTRISK